MQNGKKADVQILLNDENGNTNGFHYFLEMENGNWRITAVVPIEVSESLV